MPELPEVETVARGLAKAWTDRTIARVALNRADLRFPFPPDFCARLTGRTVRAVERRAKYLLVRLDGGLTLVIHLGMSGAIRLFGAPGAADGRAGAPTAHDIVRLVWTPRRLERHDHVVFECDDLIAIYNDPRRFGFMTLADDAALEAMFANLGVEPLHPALSGATVARRLSGTTSDLKAALLDQRRIAGLGNIYVCEALHRAKLSPWAAATTVAGEDRAARAAAGRLARAICVTLNAAIAAGGSSLRDFSATDGKPGYFQHSFRVYDRAGAPCPRRGCGGKVARKTQAGRTTFYCARCQT